MLSKTAATSSGQTSVESVEFLWSVECELNNAILFLKKNSLEVHGALLSVNPGKAQACKSLNKLERGLCRVILHLLNEDR